MNGLSTALLIATIAGAPSGAEYKSVIIVGVNESFDESQPDLRFADDDAARFYEILEPQANDLQLLTVLDDESQELFPFAASVARPPTRQELADALARVFAEGREAKRRGHRSELYFIYTGHGRIEGGEGQVRLADGHLSRSELVSFLLKSESHDRIHLIVDACNAYHLVAARGAEGRVTQDFDDAFEKFVEGHALDEYPRVGVVLSTSGAGATHEWSRYQGGVFSHEVRSALTGAADANEDGRVDYTELEAFLAAANVAVPVPKGKPKVFVRAPAIERKAALLEMERDLPVLTLPGEVTGHYYLEDDRGLRYAELNKAEGHAVKLRLIPRARYALVRSDGAAVATIEEPRGALTVDFPFDVKPPSRQGRGDDVPPGAFAEPFGPSFVDGFRAKALAERLRLEPKLKPKVPALVVEVEPEDPIPEVVGYAAGGVAFLAAAGTIWQAQVASDAHEKYENTYRKPEKEAFEGDVRAARNRAIALGVTAGVTALGSALVFLLWE